MQKSELNGKIKAYFSEWATLLKKRWWLMLIELVVLGVVLVLDLVSKEYICKFLSTQDGLFYELAPGFINLQYTENTGAGFGIFQGKTDILTALTFVVIIALMVFLILNQKEGEWLRISLIFIIGGGIGNNVDRIAFGYVRDFVQFAFWEEFAIFNIADSFVVIGAFMLIIVLIVILVQEGKKGRALHKDEAEKLLQETETASDPLDNPINLNPMMSSPNTYTFEQSKVDEKNVVDVDNDDKPLDDNGTKLE